MIPKVHDKYDFLLNTSFPFYSEKGYLVIMKPTLLDGYSVVRVGNNRIPKRAHRVIYEFIYGRVPKGLCVCHTCDNRQCVNIDHLWLGTIADNMKDMISKGRGKQPDNKGSKHGMSKLTEKEVKQIKKLLQSKSLTQIEIAEKYNVSRTTIYEIKVKRTWRHL